MFKSDNFLFYLENLLKSIVMFLSIEKTTKIIVKIKRNVSDIRRFDERIIFFVPSNSN